MKEFLFFMKEEVVSGSDNFRDVVLAYGIQKCHGHFKHRYVFRIRKPGLGQAGSCRGKKGDNVLTYVSGGDDTHLSKTMVNSCFPTGRGMCFNCSAMSTKYSCLLRSTRRNPAHHLGSLWQM